MKPAPLPSDEQAMTEVEIAPDGRIYVFGASPQVLEILERLGSKDSSLPGRLSQVRRAKADSTASIAITRAAGTSQTHE